MPDEDMIGDGIADDVEALIQVLEDDLELIQTLKQENDELRRANKRLREQRTGRASGESEPTRPEEQERDGSEEEDASYSYSEGGWRGDDPAEDIKQVDDDTINEQEQKVRKLLEDITRGDTDG